MTEEYRVSVWVIEPGAPEQQPEIVLCSTRSEEHELISMCEVMGREVCIASSSPHAAWFQVWREAYQERK